MLTTRQALQLIRLGLVTSLLLVAGCSGQRKSVATKTDGGTRQSGAAGKQATGTKDAAVQADGGATRDSGTATRRDGGAAGVSGDAGMRKDAGKATDAGATSSRDAANQGASTDGGGKLCPDLGWCEITNTKLASVCPDPVQYSAIQANEGCGGVINDWGGGMADEKRNRLLIWGGGHRGYFGNEVYALDLNKLAMLRLNDPSDITGVDLDMCDSPEAYADGRPSSRHTYDGLAYLPDQDAMYAVAGAGIPCGYGVSDTWTLDLATVDSAPLGHAAPWTNMNADPHPTKAAYGVVADYDSNTKVIVLNDTYNLWSYDVGANKYTLLNDSNSTNAHIDYHMTGRVDPKRKLFVIVGGKGSADGGMIVFDISQGSNYAQQDWTSQVTGCDALLAANSPGFAYDPVQDRMIGWAGGDLIYLFDPDSKTCTTVSYGGSPAAPNENGTFGRFRYFPALKLFAIVNDYHANAFTLRLTR